MKSLKIGNICLKNRLFLAPMVDVTDLAYRMICREQGAAMAYTEMINIGAILHENKKTLNMLKTNSEDKPLGIQITGRNVKEFEKVVPFVSDEKKYNLVDINCGCPSSRITGNESGSYLLKTPKKIGEIIGVLKDAGLIVTAKIRLGFDKNNVIKVSKEIEKAGAELLTIHARLASQKSSVPADWKWISKVKSEIGIPVVGNGGIVSGSTAKEMLEITDGAMIAGAAIGNPLIFKQILHYLKTGKEKEFSYKERLGMFEKYLRLAKEHDIVEIPRVKYLGGKFLRGFEGAASARESFMKLKNIDDMRSFIRKL